MNSIRSQNILRRRSLNLVITGMTLGMSAPGMISSAFAQSSSPQDRYYYQAPQPSTRSGGQPTQTYPSPSQSYPTTTQTYPSSSQTYPSSSTTRSYGPGSSQPSTTTTSPSGSSRTYEVPVRSPAPTSSPSGSPTPSTNSPPPSVAAPPSQPSSPVARPTQPVAPSVPAPAVAAPNTPAENSARCMNVERSLPTDTVVAGCTATVQDTLKNLATAYYLRALAVRSKRDFDGALADLNQAIGVDPSDSEYLVERGNTYDAKGDLDRALADYSQALKVNPRSANAFQSRGGAFQRKNDYARAAADYVEVTRLQPRNAEAWSALCWARAAGGREIRQALSDCNEALKLKPDAIDALDSRGFVQFKLNQFDAAIEDYNAALKIDPKYAPSLYARGIARQRKGDRNGASDVTAAQQIASGIADEMGRFGLR